MTDVSCSTIHEEDNLTGELKVTFFPALYLQRRMWVLDILRKEQYTDILDIGCGEGELLQTLSNPAPWLTPPPLSILPPSSSVPPDPEARYNPADDPIQNLHPVRIAGLDISEHDLSFAIESTRPPPSPPPMVEEAQGVGYGGSPIVSRSVNLTRSRWEEMEAGLWHGGLEVINEEFAGRECIVSMEVIEHLPPEIFPFFAPVLLGVYHPKALLVTTPSYTYNARFTAPEAPKSARKGFPDPTGRTDRIFRHHDHKFEWTLDEFRSWCDEAAAEWGYEVVKDSIGRAQEKDEWGRDAILGGASQVAAFRRIDDETVRGVSDREKRARELVAHLQLASSLNTSPHVLLARHIHSAHRKSKQPASFLEIGDRIKAIMQGYHEAFMRLEELWFEKDVPEMCGGYMEILVRAVEEHADLSLRKEIRDGKLGDKPEWMVDLLGAVPPKELWPVQDDESMELPVEQAYTPSTSDDDSSERGHDSADADVSWNEWEPEESHDVWGTAQWSNVRLSKESGWGKVEQGNEKVQQWVPESIMSATSSTAGWDGDYSDSGDTTS